MVNTVQSTKISSVSDFQTIEQRQVQMTARLLLSTSNDSMTNTYFDRDPNKANRRAAMQQSSAAALHQSIMDGRLKQVQYLLKLGSRSNTKDIFGRTSLMLACLCDHEDYGYKVAKLLIEYGADLNIQDHLGRTAVFMACIEKREKIIELFVDQNPLLIDYRLCDVDGNTLINYAAMHATPKSLKSIVNKMIKMYIPVDMRNNAGYTAFLLVSRLTLY
jgi:ankyrin repeat protein